MSTPRQPTSLTLLAEYLQISLELLGIVLVAAGSGVLAAWWCGWAGFLIVSGVMVCGAAYLFECRIRPPAPKTKPAPAPPPTTYIRGSEPSPTSTIVGHSWWRFVWLAREPKPRVVTRVFGRVGWLGDQAD